MIYAFLDYELDLRLYELRRADTAQQIEPRAFDLLVYLIQRRDRVVLKSELLEQLWSDRVVSEATLSQCVRAARKAAGDTGRTQRVIRTHHGRGYRFVAKVSVRQHEERERDSSPALA
jgi:adenylate cyclase